MEKTRQPTSRLLWSGNWTLDHDVDEVAIFKLRFSDNGQGTLSVMNDNTGYLCTTFYSAFSRTNGSTKFEFTFARGRMKGEFVIDKSRRMLLTVTDCSLPQIPLSDGTLEWRLSRC